MKTIPRPRRLPPQSAPKLAITWVFVALQGIFAVIHGNLRLVQSVKSTNSLVVVYIQSLGPVWITLFGITSVTMALGVLTRRLIATTHLVSAAVWMMYAAALWCGSMASNPGGPIAYATMTTALAAFCMIMAWVYARLWEHP